ncbi:acetyltransferase, ribosomal protein n-acetylase [Halogeometricum pallidum JCM 14848]|uniref:Acetyltransferase, ribosomal protein n-acetylase n=1 Tax=Halogeometricum pallidum JCM 14848 TaxID=1227487 RepID=M0DMB3_HALPD|nr:acetyltransferase, ribosomal protein n-acetylase [Halogeometricum pallidum JCM 14848]
MGPARNAEGDARFLAACEERWDDGEAAEYAVRLRDTGELLGMTGIDCDWKHDAARPGSGSASRSGGAATPANAPAPS